MHLTHLAARLFGTPLLIHRPKLEVILSVVGPRMGLEASELAAFSPRERLTPASSGGIMILPVHGTLVRRSSGLEPLSGMSSYQSIAADLQAAISNPAVSALLLDIDSPGGEAGGVFDLVDQIRALGQVKPIWAVANDSACSAAYAIGSAAKRLYVSRTGCLGSIGVIAMHVDQSLRDAQQGLRFTTVFAGERKNDLNPHEPISDAALVQLKNEVNRLYDLFIETVAVNRQLSTEAVRQTEAGLFYGQAAVEYGLADQVGTLDTALADLASSLQTEPHRPPLTSAAFLLSSSLKLEHPMPETTPATPAPTAPPVTQSVIPAARDEDLSGSAAREIAELCQIAGCPERIAAYLVANTSPALVRRELLDQRATGDELYSRLNPEAKPASPQSLDNNPVVLAARARALKEK